MQKYNQLIFLDGKEKALDALFKGVDDDGITEVPAAFGYLALGYNDEVADNGFEEPKNNPDVDKNGGFKEITDAENYERIPLKASAIPASIDTQNSQIIKKYEAELTTDNVTNHYINQFAICDSKDTGDENTVFYSAASFDTFNKTSNTSITFIVGFKI